uniref:SWIM-type domain-containing protein n=1 Tax=Arundo donax TaxID=35708 RepID=A0A0A9GHQ6_ARUDO
MVHPFSVQEYRFEVTSRSKRGLSMDCRVVTHEVNLGQSTIRWCKCNCNKLNLLHVPYSHRVAACGQLEMPTMRYISEFYLKENIVQTRTGEFQGVLHYVYNYTLPHILPHSKQWLLVPHRETEIPLHGGRTADCFQHRSNDHFVNAIIVHRLTPMRPQEVCERLGFSSAPTLTHIS